MYSPTLDRTHFLSSLSTCTVSLDKRSISSSLLRPSGRRRGIEATHVFKRSILGFLSPLDRTMQWMYVRSCTCTYANMQERKHMYTHPNTHTLKHLCNQLGCLSTHICNSWYQLEQNTLCPLTHSPTHPFTYSLTPTLTHLPTHPPTHSPTPLTPLTRPLTHLPTHPPTHSPTPLTPLTRPLTHLLTHPPTHSLTPLTPLTRTTLPLFYRTPAWQGVVSRHCCPVSVATAEVTFVHWKTAERGRCQWRVGELHQRRVACCGGDSPQCGGD